MVSFTSDWRFAPARSREIVRALAGRADGLIEGYRPGVMERLGLGRAHVHEHDVGLLAGFQRSDALAKAVADGAQTHMDRAEAIVATMICASSRILASIP